MIRKIFMRELEKFEKQTGFDTTFMKIITRQSIRLFLYFSRFTKLSTYRKNLPKELYYIAKIGALIHIRCDECLKLNIFLAKKDGVEQILIDKILKGVDQLNKKEKLVYDFSISIIKNDECLDIYRKQIKDNLGEQALVEISIAVASANFYSLVKKGITGSGVCHYK